MLSKVKFVVSLLQKGGIYMMNNLGESGTIERG